MKEEIKEIYLSNLEWTKTHDDIGGVMGNAIFKDNMSYEEYQKMQGSGYFVLCNKDYITNLQEKINQYENPDDLTLFYMWLDEKAKDKMKELQTTVNNCKERIAYLERSNDRREDTIIGLRMDITDLEDIIYKLEKWLLLEISIHSDDDVIDTLYSCVLDKIKVLKGDKDEDKN